MNRERKGGWAGGCHIRLSTQPSLLLSCYSLRRWDCWLRSTSGSLSLADTGGRGLGLGCTQPRTSSSRPANCFSKPDQHRIPSPPTFVSAWPTYPTSEASLHPNYTSAPSVRLTAMLYAQQRSLRRGPLSPRSGSGRGRPGHYASLIGGVEVEADIAPVEG
eukprot:3726651-Rhodomonas_salina.1